MTALFLGFVTLIAVLAIGLIARYLGNRTARIVAAALLAWLIYVGSIGYFGVIRNIALRPPGPAFLFLPVIVFLFAFVAATRSGAGERIALAFPLWLLVATQSFRVLVELFLHQLWHDGLIPKMLTFSGANFDIYVGASAPLIAWLVIRSRPGARIAFVWNILGLLALANVVTRAVLTAPGPLNLIHAEVPNLMIGTFPYMFIPGFFVPLAVVLHILALRAIIQRRAIAWNG